MKPRYRAWDKEENRWINIASLVFDEEGELWYLSPVMDDFNPVYYENELGKTWEIMQSTGLKDKNDVEIFEGDVIGSQNKDRSNWYVSHHRIVWHDTGFFGKQICSRSFIGLEHWTRGENGYVVIGNIYENPELLEPANEI